MQLKILLGKRVRELRKNKKMTQETLAEMVDIDYKNIGKIEMGQNYPSALTLEKIAEALEVEEKDLFEFNHLQEPKDLEKEIVKIFRHQTKENQKLIYKLIKSFE